MGHDFSSLMAMVIDVTVAMEEKTLRELGEFRPDCVVADSICVWGKLYARRLGLPLVCSTTTFAFDQETAREMRPGPLEVFYTLVGLPQIGKRLALLREHGYEVEKLTELIQNDSETDTIVHTSRAFQPGGEHFGERVAFCGAVPAGATAPDAAAGAAAGVRLPGHGYAREHRLLPGMRGGPGDGPWDVLLSVGSPEGAAALGALPPQCPGRGQGGVAPGAGGGVGVSHPLRDEQRQREHLVRRAHGAGPSAVGGGGGGPAGLRSWGRGCAWSAAARRRSGPRWSRCWGIGRGTARPSRPWPPDSGPPEEARPGRRRR